MNISPKSHVYRLAVVLAVCFMSFLVLRSYAVPASWNYKAWYRSGNQEDMKKLPLSYGGNASCQPCHEDISLVGAVKVKAKGKSEDFEDEFFEEKKAGPETAMKFEHKTLSCESCHGPLAHHANGDKKIGDAIVMNDSNWQCMNCHTKLISRPASIHQFTLEVEKHKEMSKTTLCIKCHNPHDPIDNEIAVDEKKLDFGGEL